MEEDAEQVLIPAVNKALAVNLTVIHSCISQDAAYVESRLSTDSIQVSSSEYKLCGPVGLDLRKSTDDLRRKWPRNVKIYKLPDLAHAT